MVSSSLDQLSSPLFVPAASQEQPRQRDPRNLSPGDPESSHKTGVYTRPKLQDKELGLEVVCRCHLGREWASYIGICASRERIQEKGKTKEEEMPTRDPTPSTPRKLVKIQQEPASLSCDNLVHLVLGFGPRLEILPCPVQVTARICDLNDIQVLVSEPIPAGKVGGAMHTM